MSTIFSLRRTADEDGRTAGGKIPRSRRARAVERTPYARPTQLPPPAENPVAESSGNPNWLSGLIHPARAIASGAGKILSSVFGPDYYSSSSSSSGGDCLSEDEDDDAQNAADGDLNKAKSENMQLIQQLVMQQTFSREECEELINLIRSRVVVGDGNLSNTDACNDVVLEARKWLKEKRSASKLLLEDQIFDTNYAALSQANQSDMGSPVNMAKSYMQAQPTWSSPAFKRVEFSTPSPMQSSKEFFCNPVRLAEMKGSALSSGSWNILDEIRRVRTKATEELLAKTPSKKIGDELNSDPNGSRLPESVEMECEKSQDGALQTNNANLAVKQRQDGETIQVIGGSDAANGTHSDVNSDQLDGRRRYHEIDGLRDSATNDDHAISLSAPDQPLEPVDKETTEKDDNLIASQDSSSMAYEDLTQDVTKTYPHHKEKNSTRARTLRPRNKSGKSSIIK